MPCLRLCLVAVALSAAHGFALSRSALATAPTRRASLQPAARSAPLVCAEQPADKGGSKLPFFLDLGTKGGIIFYSIVGIALPFVAYSFMIDNLGYDVVLAGNVILIGYVGLATVAWTGRCAIACPLARTPSSDAQLRGLCIVSRFMAQLRLPCCQQGHDVRPAAARL